MAYPSGSGTEVLRNVKINSQSNDATSFRFDGTDPTVGTESYAVPTNVIITILNITIAEQSNGARTLSMWINHESGPIGNQLLTDQAFTAYGPAFIWSDKIVLHPTDIIIVQGSASSSFDIMATYLYQDWT